MQSSTATSSSRLLRRGRRAVPLVLLILVLVVLVALPFASIIYASLTDTPPRPGNLGGALSLNNFSILFTPTSIQATLNSLAIAVVATSIATVLGTALAWLTQRSNVPMKALVTAAAVVPLFISPFVGAFSWLVLGSERRGILNLPLQELGVDFRINIGTLGGIIFVLVLYYIPYVFLLVSSAMSLMNPEFEDAAAVHGASRWRVFRHVSMPLSLPAIGGAAILTFILIIENFPVPQLLGARGGVNTLPGLIYRLTRLSAPSRANEAAAVGLLLTAAMIGMLMIQRSLIRGREYTTVSGKGFKPRLVDLGALRWPVVGLVGVYFVLSSVLPTFALFVSGFRPNPYIGSLADLFDTSEFNFGTIVRVVEDSQFMRALWTSLIVGVGTAVLGTLLHFVLSYLTYRTRLRGRALFEYVAMSPLAVPSLVLGMGFLWTWLYLPWGLYGSVWILILAYIVAFMPQGFRGISASILQVHRDLEEAAVISGASRARATWFVVIPLIRSSVFATALLLLVLSMREVTATLFLYTAQTKTLSILVFDLWEAGQVSRASAVALIYSAILLVITLVGRRWLQQEQTTTL